MSYEHPGISEEMYKIALTLIRNIEKESDKSASILMFLPGIFEIGRMHTVLTDYAET